MDDMPRMLNELQLRLLRDFDGTREVLTAADELEQVVRKALSDHVRAWIDAALEGDWQADLQDRSVMGRLAFWRSSWRREIQGATEIMMCGYLGVDLDVGEEGGSWTCHVLGAAPVTFRGGIAFDGLGRYLGGPDRALRLTQPMREQLSRGGFLVTTGPAGFREGLPARTRPHMA
ncbi:MAG: hypothetical protein IT371_20675 [Deltaproteobacteria bacterium]|nr:hypothetical protein [Deltaproteobacteria bacterium]